MNLIKKAQFAKNSLRNLIDSHFFSNTGGMLTYKGIRYFHCESNIMYIIEQELEKLPNGEGTLFEACFEFGQQLQQQYGGKDFRRFIGDYFPALGWGDIFVSTKNRIEVVSIYYPWTPFSSDSKYTIFRGVLSGFISSCLGKRIELKKYETSLTDMLTVKLYEL